MYIFIYIVYNTCSTFIHALISCLLDYCNSIMSNVPRSKTDRLQILQNQCARIFKNRQAKNILPQF